jgi:hypothetical protein
VPAVRVDDVGDGVERVERNADRQDHVEHRQLGAPAEEIDEIIDRSCEESGVFEEAKQQQIDGDRRDHQQLALARVSRGEKSATCRITHECGEHHQQTETRIPITVENVTGDREPYVTLPCASQAPVDDIRHRQEGKEEDEAVE